MSNLVEEIKLPKGMKKADFKQLSVYIHDFDTDNYDSCYWGNKEQFYKRHGRLVALIDGFCDMISEHGERLPR